MIIKLTHACPSCNGALSIDHKIDKYICSKCGALYELDHFGTDSLRDLGNEAIARRDFNTARIKFEKVLDQEPGSFEDLRALLFCDLQIQTLDEIKDVEKLASYTRIPKLSLLREKASGEDKEFFDKFNDAYEDSKSYMSMAGEYNTSLAEVKRLYGKVVQLESSVNGGLKPVKLDKNSIPVCSDGYPVRNAYSSLLNIFCTSDPDDVRNLVLCSAGLIGGFLLYLILGIKFGFAAGVIVLLATFVYFIVVFISICIQNNTKKKRLLPELNSAKDKWIKMDADLKERRKQIESFRDDIAKRYSELAAYKR